jgi:hypothetical protein
MRSDINSALYLRLMSLSGDKENIHHIFNESAIAVKLQELEGCLSMLPNIQLAQSKMSTIRR